MRANGAAVKAIRERSGLRATEFAREVCISPQYLSGIEAGDKPGSEPVLFRMAQILKVPVTALIADPDDWEPRRARR